jgi:EamA domain-containing membrane protein RarD
MQRMEMLLNQNMWMLSAMFILALWVLPWKGYALWLAARNSHKKWFIILLTVNTLAILDIIYIFAVGRKKKKSAK